MDLPPPAETMHRAALLFNHHYQSRQASSKSGIFPALGQNEAVFEDHTQTPEYRLWGDEGDYSGRQLGRCLHVCSALLVFVIALLLTAPVP